LALYHKFPFSCKDIPSAAESRLSRFQCEGCVPGAAAWSSHVFPAISTEITAKAAIKASKGGKTWKSRKTPGTGDTTNIYFWLLLLVLSSIMLGTVWYMKKKMEKDTNQRR
jgi:hypothetical protein